MIQKFYKFEESELDRIIEMAWEDRTSFEAIKMQFGLNEQEVRELMKFSLKKSSYILWRKRVEKNSIKHSKKRSSTMLKFKSNQQRIISQNKISKR